MNKMLLFLIAAVVTAFVLVASSIVIRRSFDADMNKETRVSLAYQCGINHGLRESLKLMGGPDILPDPACAEFDDEK